jgi:2,4-dienoyl-CoA reductase-like NADH-dependent reductase (Old Yellow Enzyme family)
MADLFSPFPVRGITLRNRIVLSPMCQYSSIDGFANDWHLAHLGGRAVGGTGLILAEATGVEARGRITPNCLGLWKDEHIEGHKRVTDFIRARGVHSGIQLAHAGVKASRHRPFGLPQGARSNGYVPPEQGGWMPVGPTADRFGEDGPVPHELTIDEVRSVRDSYAAAAKRAVAAGYDLVELHFAHGYLGHSFLSPLMNRRTDGYGGPFDHRVSFLLETAKAVREAIPESMPLFVRLSTTDWVEGGWTIEDSIEASRLMKRAGVDLVDCSSGGATRRANIPTGPMYQVPLAARIRAEAEIPTGAVGMITEPKDADAIVREGKADLVFLGRQLLREPYWPLRAWQELEGSNADGPAAPIATEYAWALGETRRR